MSIKLDPIGPILSNRRKPLTDADKAHLKHISGKFLAEFVALVEAWGGLRTDTSGKKITTELFILAPIAYRALLDHVRETLGMGRVNVHGKWVRFSIGKTDLQQKLLPLLQYHGIFFLTPPLREQCVRLIYVLENGLKWSKDLLAVHFPPVADLEFVDVVDVAWLNAWVAGYISALGSFFVDEEGIQTFSVSYRPYDNVYTIFSWLFHPYPEVYFGRGALFGDPELAKYASDFVVRSDNGLMRVIGFVNRHGLIGPRKVEFEKWLADLIAATAQGAAARARKS